MLLPLHAVLNSRILNLTSYFSPCIVRYISRVCGLDRRRRKASRDGRRKSASHVGYKCYQARRIASYRGKRDNENEVTDEAMAGFKVQDPIRR